MTPSRGSHTLVSILCFLLFALTATAQTNVYVELKSPAPVVVARYQAQKAGLPFNAETHRTQIRAAQDQLLAELAAAGVSYSLTSTSVKLGAGDVAVPDRYSELINAVRLAVTPDHVALIRANDRVKHISVDTPRRIRLNRSTEYIRVTGADSARSRGLRGAGQVIAVLDTGIDHTHPMFDSRVDDSRFTERTGDLRPVRLQGTPYVPGVNHPKVAYRFLFSTAPVEGDDTGHGTSVASAAAGLKAQADATLQGGEIVEGVAPDALLMDYKVCPSLVCETQQILLSLEDSVRETDLAGNPKPVATVINMSFGDTAGDPYSADAIAAGNLQFAGIFPEASAGNGCDLIEETVFGVCLTENIIGSPAAGRLVVATAASIDPGLAPNGIDVLTPDRSGVQPGTAKILATFAPESNATEPIGSAIVENYVYVGFGDTPDDVPETAFGRICLAERGGDVDLGAAGSGFFVNKATQCSARGGIALVVFNNAPGPVGVVLAPAAIPVFTISREDGLVLRDTLGFGANGISNHPISINPPDPALFRPEMAGFSSRGPNNDYLVVKPDITAPGVQILMAASKIGALGDPRGYTSADGTSFSGPQLAGTAALLRGTDGGRPSFTPSMVRAVLMNSSTHLREADNVTPIADNDVRNFIHATGSGLVDMVRALNLRAIMGTNELNGAGGPDDHGEPDFLPSYSFGEPRLIGTGLAPADLRQQRTITVTMFDLSGAGGTYSLAVVDGGADRGDITRPLSTPGFSLKLSSSSITVPANGKTTFQVTVSVDGRANGLQLAGTDQLGVAGTEFLWWVVASSNGTKLRMPFFFRAAQGAPGGGAVASSDGIGWIPAGSGKGQFKFAADQASGGTIRYQDSSVSITGTVAALSASGPNAAFSGPCTLKDGTGCEFTAEVQDNADPGKGADRFKLTVTTSSGQTFSSDALLGAGNIQVRTQ